MNSFEDQKTDLVPDSPRHTQPMKSDDDAAADDDDDAH